VLARMPQTAERGQGNVFDILRFQRMAKRVTVELRVMARTWHSANVRKACDSVGMQQCEEALDGQGRMPEGEDRVLRPLCFLRIGMLAHAAPLARSGFRVSNIGPYTSSNKPNAAIQHAPATRSRKAMN